MRLLGFEVGEVWGHALNLPENSPAWPNIEHCYRHVIDHWRGMVKLEEWYRRGYGEAKDKFLARLHRARSLGLKVVFCLDWHNSWLKMDPNPNNYHKYTWFPPGPLPRAVRDVLLEVQPDVFQVANEPYAKTNLGTKEYAERVYDYVRGAREAGFKGLILANQTDDSRGHVADGWEWHVGHNPEDPGTMIVEWQHGLAEGKHRHPRVLHGLTSVAGVRAALESNAWAGRRIPKGWRHLVWHDEVSFPGKEIHINTPLGAEVMLEGLHFFRQKKVPLTFLTMGGSTDNWGADGDSGWGMNTSLINRHGELSMGCKALYDFKGVPYPDGTPPIDPPEPPGNGGGIKKIKSAKKVLDRSVEDWGSRDSYDDARLADKRVNKALELAGED